ncbi:Fanconi anemia group A protein-like [Cimex lectularius]|uniref:Fanconi anaemia group A protein N-terminal domain-containing protein n=1 Tax=Cimex lectularius TaxID=79782 RepID=A0A8I6RIL4_CIMLE|nr:Fanconi anemia group A protein-like [Cimex lectularius]
MSTEITNGNELCRLSLERSETFQCLMTEVGRQRLDEFMADEKCQNRSKRKSIFKEWLDTDDWEPPLELLWKLNEEEMLFVTTYFYLHENYALHLYQSFERVYSEPFDSEEKELAISIISNVLVTLVNTYFITEEEFKRCFQGIVNNIINQGISLLDQNRMKRCYISDMLNSVYIFDSCLNQFSLSCLQQLLCFPSGEMSLGQVVHTHTQLWTVKTMSEIVKHFIFEILRLMTAENVLHELKLAGAKPTLNWKYFLMIVSIFIEDSPDNSAMIRREVETWLQSGLDQSSRHFISLAVIVARHCSHGKTKNLNNYINWYGSIQLKTSSMFRFFLDFLTELVPHEPPLYLKIHTNKVLVAPQNCQDLLSDYLSLAKTRLSDLKESTEYLGLFNDLHETDQIGLDYDVAKAISMFRESGEIPKAVLEAHVFRRSYFEKMFLKNLLKIGEKVDSDRAQFIHKLFSMGKIPNTLYKAWKEL